MLVRPLSGWSYLDSVQPERIAILWVHFGPYHLARLRALRKHSEVVAIEFARGQKMYAWQSEVTKEVMSLQNTAYEQASSWKVFSRLWQLLNTIQTDILFIPGYREPLALLAATWGKMHGRPNVLMFDSTELDHPRSVWKERSKAILVNWLFERSFVSGKRAKRYLQTMGIQTAQIEQGYDVVDNEFFAAQVSLIRDRKSSYLESGPFLFVGRLVDAKSPQLLLEAFELYRQSGGQRDLEIAGHGPLENALRTFAANCGYASSIRFLGHRPYESLPECYARAACLILPSCSEPWGLVVNEAMASGLPVIVSDRCGCVDDLVEDGRNGFVFPAQSARELANRMLALDAVGTDGMKAMGQRSQEIIAKYTLETWTDAVLRLAQNEGRCNAAA